MSAKEIEKAVLEAREELKALDSEEAAIMDMVREPLLELAARRSEAESISKQKLQSIFDDVTYDDLTDPLKALVIYELAWNRGNGMAGVREKLAELFPNSYVSSEPGGYQVISDDYTSALLVLQLSIPAKKDEETLARTAELIAPVYRAALQLSDEAYISVFDDGLSELDTYKITLENDLWSISGRYRTLFASSSLVDVLRKTPTYY